MINALFEHFVEASPLTVMMRAIMERIFAADKLDALFEQVADRQYTRTLLFSSVVGLMGLVVSGIHPSVSAAYKALEKIIGVSRPALYGKLNWQALAPLNEVGNSATGIVSEQPVQLATQQGHDLTLRRVVVRLNQPTRHGDWEVVVFTNLPTEVADALTVADFYLSRWSVEEMFQVITDVFPCELNTLGYPKAALFVFGMAVVAFNILSTLKAALKAVHGAGKIESGLSDFYVVEEV